jgi:hypothetical protein
MLGGHRYNRLYRPLGRQFAARRLRLRVATV